MSYSRRQLYALGEPLGDSVTKTKPGGGYLCGDGGKGGESKSDSSTTSTNTDQRVAVQDGLGLSGSSGNTISVNSPDAIKAVAQLGAETIARTGEAIVQLNRDSSAANLTAWDKTVTVGAQLVDKLIDKSTGVATAAISSYQPTENKTQDTTQKVVLYAAAAGAAALLLARFAK